MLRALGFSFSSSSHSHRHSADQHPVGLTLRGRPTYRLSANRRGKENAPRFGFLFLKLFTFAPPFGG
jgi:hypothetical protein